jgi:FkbM family methyltransferase
MVHYPRAVSPTEARMISYAQNAEDVLIDRVFRKKSGFYIDVGAFHPIVDSVTKHFSLLGWTGINIEPDPEFAAELRRDRPNDINLCLAVGSQSGEAILHLLGARQCSTISGQRFAQLAPESREGAQTLSVPLRSLAEICAEHVTGEIDFLKIDVEGAEKDVIEGADWQRFRPRLLVIEATKPSSSEPDWMEWEPLILAQDYLFQHFDGINRYYLRREDEDLAPQLSVPVNYLDWYLSFGDMLQMQQLFKGQG